MFNMIGYKLWITYLENKANTRLEAVLDLNQYKENELIKISLPLNDPYQNDWSEYKRVDGEISFDGKIYHYVKEKVQFGQLLLLCVPDHEKMKLETGLNSKHLPTKAILNASQDECIPVLALTFENAISINVTPTIMSYHADLNTSYHLTIEQPPDVLTA